MTRTAILEETELLLTLHMDDERVGFQFVALDLRQPQPPPFRNVGKPNSLESFTELFEPLGTPQAGVLTGSSRSTGLTHTTLTHRRRQTSGC